MNTVDVRLLPKHLRDRVLAVYREALKKETRGLTYEEAAWYYGYTYGSIRHLVHHGRLRATGPKQRRRITHGAMRDYLRRRKHGNTPRKALKAAQTKIR